MSQTSSKEQQHQQEQKQKHQQRKRTRIATAGTDRNEATVSVKTVASATRTKTRTRTAPSTISSSRNSSPAPSSRTVSSVVGPSIHHNNDEQALAKNKSNSNNAVEGTSLLGSVWNLFRDVKDLASKEIDRLLEHFPYNNNTTRVIATANPYDLQDRLLSVKKRKGVTSLTSASLPRKSLLGHGPPQRRRAGSPQGSQATLSKRLLDDDLRTQVNDISSRRIPTAPLSVVSGVSSDSRRMLSARSRSVSAVSETGSRQSSSRRQPPLATPRPTLTPPLLKRDSSTSATLYRSSQDTEADWSSAVSHLDELESDSSLSRMSVMMSRESSATPPITTMAHAMSISGHSHLSQRPLRGERSTGSDTRKRSYKQSTTQLHRDSSFHSEPDLTRDVPERLQRQQQHIRDNNLETPIYPQVLKSHNQTHSGSRTPLRDNDSPPSTFTDSKNNPFIASSGNPSPTHNSGASSPPSNIDNATFTALVQQVTTMREQLASLLAEKDIQQRTYSASASVSPGVPPPPPPPPLFPETPSSKMRTPPVNEATRSMARVLNELSTSKVQLRKTGSPFLSRISSAVDSSPNSKFSRVVFRSRMEKVLDKYSGDSDTGSTAPLSLVSHLRGPSNGTDLKGCVSQPLDRVTPETPSKRGTQPIFQEPEEEGELSWPSPGTVMRADSRLEVAVKDISRKVNGNEKSTAVLRSSSGMKTKQAENEADYETPKAHPLVESKRKWTSRSSYTTETKPTDGITTARINSTGNAAGSEGMPEGSVELSVENDIFGRERSGPRLDSNKRPHRPARPRSMVLSRSMTDPTTSHNSGIFSAATPTMTIADKERERQWFLESDMDGWKVAQ